MSVPACAVHSKGRVGVSRVELLYGLPDVMVLVISVTERRPFVYRIWGSDYGERVVITTELEHVLSGSSVTFGHLPGWAAIVMAGKFEVSVVFYRENVDSRVLWSAGEVPAEVKQAAALLSSRGNSAGGKARAAKLSPERRREIAQKAARARWAKP